MKKLTLTLSLALVVGPAAGALVCPDPVFAADEDPVADWDKKFDKALEKAADYHEKLAKWCNGNGLEWTGTIVLRGVFKYLPEHEETRAYFGYDKRGGRWIQSDLRRDEFRTQFIDDEDPNGKKFRTNLSKMTEKIAKDFRALAAKAEKDAEDPEFSGSAAALRERAKKAWWVVLRLRPDRGEEKGMYKYTLKYQDEAHKSLGHPKFEGEYVTPFALKHRERRAERVRRGKEINATDPAVEEATPEGPFAAAGLTGGSTKSEHVTSHSSNGKEVAARICKAAEKSIADALATYQFPEEVKDRLGLRTMYNVKPVENDHHAEWKRFLKAAGWPDGDIERYREAGLTGVGGGGWRIQITSTGPEVEDNAINVYNQQCAQAAAQIAGQSVGRTLPGPEDWLWQSMGYDATMRINDTAITVWGAFGKYGQNVRARPGENVWIQLARQQVELDDDVPMSVLFPKTLENQEFKGREIVKGYAYLQFLFESDPDKAREFI